MNCHRCNQTNPPCDCGTECRPFCTYCGVLLRPAPRCKLDVQIEKATNEDWRTQ